MGDAINDPAPIHKDIFIPRSQSPSSPRHQTPDPPLETSQSSYHLCAVARGNILENEPQAGCCAQQRVGEGLRVLEGILEEEKRYAWCLNSTRRRWKLKILKAGAKAELMTSWPKGSFVTERTAAV